MLSGYRSYARVGEIDRVAKTFEHADQKAYEHLQYEPPDNNDHDHDNANHDDDYDDDYDYDYDEGGGGDDQSSNGDSS